MSQISALVAANSLPQLALPLIEAASQSGSSTQFHSTPSKSQDTVTISSEATALQSSSK